MPERRPAFQCYASDDVPRKRLRRTAGCPYPNVCFDVDAVEALADSFLGEMDHEEYGRFWRGLAAAAQQGDFAYLSRFPFVGRVYTHTGPRAHIPTSVRREVLSAGKCVFCGGTERLTVDHLIPVSKGGGDEIENLQCACRRCNLAKSASLTFGA